MKILYFLLSWLLLFNYVFAQNVYDPNLRKEVSELFYNSTKNSNEIIQNGYQIIEIAQNSNEQLRGYYLIGDGMYKKGNFKQSIINFNKADSLAVLENSLEDQFMITYFLYNIYSTIGIDTKAIENQQRLVKIGHKLKNSNLDGAINQSIMYVLEDQKKYNLAIPYIEKIIRHSESNSLTKMNNRDKNDLAIAYTFAAYYHLKSNHTEVAKNYIKKYENIIIDITENNNYMREIYCLSKAIISFRANEITESKNWFDKAFLYATNKNDKKRILQILEERILTETDHSTEKERFIKLYISLKNSKSEASSKAVTSEFLRQNKKIELAKNNFNKLLITSIVFLLILFGILFWNIRRRKIIKERFNTLINQIELEKKSNNQLQVKLFKKDDIHNEKIKVMSHEKETELLDKLIEFENSIIFTEKNFSMTQMAIFMNSNSKYISYILQKHRNKNFNDYINEIRIKFIIKKLINEPEYLNYKIEYLADISGYSSHSRFTQIFKKETKVAPSNFIAHLKIKN